MTDTKTRYCNLCLKNITNSRWNQHIKSKGHIELHNKQSRRLTPEFDEPEIPEEDLNEEGVKDDSETDSDYSSESDYSD